MACNLAELASSVEPLLPPTSLEAMVGLVLLFHDYQNDQVVPRQITMNLDGIPIQRPVQDSDLTSYYTVMVAEIYAREIAQITIPHRRTNPS